MPDRAGQDTGRVSANGGRVRGGAPGRLALSKVEAADALGVSVDYLEGHVMHELRIVRRGRRRLIPVRELERWLDENATRALGA
jgi:excisionase family DNA binding protein